MGLECQEGNLWKCKTVLSYSSTHKGGTERVGLELNATTAKLFIPWLGLVADLFVLTLILFTPSSCFG